MCKFLIFWKVSCYPCTFGMTVFFQFWRHVTCIVVKLVLYVLFLHVCVCFIATTFVICLYSFFYFSWYKNLYIILISFSECSFLRNFAKNFLSQRLNFVVITKEIVIYVSCFIKKLICKSDIFEWITAFWYYIVTLSCWHIKISFFFFMKLFHYVNMICVWPCIINVGKVI